MKTMKIFMFLALAVIFISCQKEDRIQIEDTIITNEESFSLVKESSFPSCDLDHLKDISDALRSRIEELLEQGDVFSNHNANGLISQLNSLDRDILKGNCEKAQLRLEEDIIPHLQRLNEDGILPSDLYEELDNFANGIFTPGPCLCSEVARETVENKGWFVVQVNLAEGNLVATQDGRPAQSNCDTYAVYNILVWKDGSREQTCLDDGFIEPYSTQAGMIYGGHIPCECGDNLIPAFEWDMKNCIPD